LEKGVNRYASEVMDGRGGPRGGIDRPAQWYGAVTEVRLRPEPTRCPRSERWNAEDAGRPKPERPRKKTHREPPDCRAHAHNCRLGPGWLPGRDQAREPELSLPASTLARRVA